MLYVLRCWFDGIHSYLPGRVFLACACVLSFSGKAHAGDFEDGVQAYTKGSYVLAAQKFEKAIKANPGNSGAMLYAGMACQRAGNDTKAREYYQKVRTKFPGSQSAQYAAQYLGVNTSQSQVQSQRYGVTSGTISAPMQQSTAAASSQPSDMAGLPDQAKIYFTKNDSGHMVIDCTVNGRPMKAMFDTGASGHFGMNQLRDAGITPPSGKPIGETKGWAGRPVPVWGMTVEVKTGNLKRTMPITVEEDASILPLIGQDLIKGYEYEIDDKGNALILRKPSVQKVASGNVSFNPLYDVPLIHGGQDDFIEMKINGRTTAAFIDTGAANTIVHPSVLKQLNIQIPDDAPDQVMNGVGGAFSVKVMELNLQVGPIIRNNFRVLIGGTAGTCVGQDFLAGWRFTADRNRKLMRFFH